MKFRLLALGAVAASIASLTAYGVRAQGNPPAPAPHVQLAALQGPGPGEGRHPQIRHALRALRAARVYMKNAAHDFGGHRVEALEATDQAIKQLQIALRYDRE
jgi:hypothetical protein